MSKSVNDEALDILFREARTQNGWEDKPVPESLLRDVWNLSRMGPTSANCSPMRIVFIVSDQAKEKLRPLLMEANVKKCMTAPAVALLGNDMAFYEKLPQLFPHTDARSWFAGNQPLIDETAFRNGSLQAAYFMLAVRALGLDCGAISGFDLEGADKAFFGGTEVKSNFLCNIGYGNGEDVFERSPRLDFDEGCSVI